MSNNTTKLDKTGHCKHGQRHTGTHGCDGCCFTTNKSTRLTFDEWYWKHTNNTLRKIMDTKKKRKDFAEHNLQYGAMKVAWTAGYTIGRLYVK